MPGNNDAISVAEAEDLLRKRGGYEWALDDHRERWNVVDVIRELKTMGFRVSDKTGAYAEEFEVVEDFGRYGVYVTRDDLMLHLAGRIRPGNKAVS